MLKPQMNADERRFKTKRTSSIEVADVNKYTEALIDAWCERRAYRALRAVLPAWPHFGHTDQVVALRNALRHARAMAKEEMTSEEQIQVGKIIGYIDATWVTPYEESEQ